MTPRRDPPDGAARRPRPARATVDLVAVLDLVRARTRAWSVRVVDGWSGAVVAVSGDPAATDPVDGPAAVARLLREETAGAGARVRTAGSIHLLRPVDGSPGAFLHLRLAGPSRAEAAVDRARAVLAEPALHVAVRCALDGTVPVVTAPAVTVPIEQVPVGRVPVGRVPVGRVPVLRVPVPPGATPRTVPDARTAPVPRPRAAPPAPGEQPALAGLADSPPGPVATGLGAAAVAGLAAALPRDTGPSAPGRARNPGDGPL